jgi:hypothetical protein
MISDQPNDPRHKAGGFNTSASRTAMPKTQQGSQSITCPGRLRKLNYSGFAALAPPLGLMPCNCASRVCADSALRLPGQARMTRWR